MQLYIGQHIVLAVDDTQYTIEQYLGSATPAKRTFWESKKSSRFHSHFDNNVFGLTTTRAQQFRIFGEKFGENFRKWR